MSVEMELIKSAGHRTRLSEVVYILFNLLLPVVLFALVVTIRTPWLAVVVLLLSKWRIFAVRPRYWVMNIKSNLVDIIVGLSFVYLLMGDILLPARIILTVLYIGWLLYLKPQSRRHAMALQAGIGQFLGLTAIFGLSDQFDSVIIVLLAWIIGYAAARHIASAYEEEHLETIGLVWGLLVAEFSWLAFHWTLAYQLTAIGINIPQIAAILTVLGFAAFDLYDNQKHTRFNPLRMRLTIAVSLTLIAVILIFARWNVSI